MTGMATMKSLYRTYEELKLDCLANDGVFTRSLYRTYEELKLALTDNIARLGILFVSYL